MSIPLGPFCIDHPFILAPMAGITHSPFRQLMVEYGSALVISELISAKGIDYGSEKTMDLLKYNPEKEPLLGIQIFGEEEKSLCEAARRVEEKKVNFIDLNLGCPVSKVVQKGGGAALCRDLSKLEKILKALVKSVRIPVSIKIRTGWTAQEMYAKEVIQIATDVGISWVAIHGRTRAQGYQGEADWELIGNLKAKSSIPILGNGDLVTPEKALLYWKKYAVDAVLIGRAVLKNPFFFRQALCLFKGEKIIQPEKEDYILLIEKKRKIFEESFSPSFAALQAKKFFSWFSSGFPGCHEFRSHIFSLPSENIQTIWDQGLLFFHQQNIKEWQEDSTPFLMGGHG